MNRGKQQTRKVPWWYFPVAILFVYYAIASVRWMVVHPKANEFTIIRYLPEVLTFSTLPEYQEDTERRTK